MLAQMKKSLNALSCLNVRMCSVHQPSVPISTMWGCRPELVMESQLVVNCIHSNHHIYEFWTTYSLLAFTHSRNQVDGELPEKWDICWALITCRRGFTDYHFFIVETHDPGLRSLMSRCSRATVSCSDTLEGPWKWATIEELMIFVGPWLSVAIFFRLIVALNRRGYSRLSVAIVFAVAIF